MISFRPSTAPYRLVIVVCVGLALALGGSVLAAKLSRVGWSGLKATYHAWRGGFVSVDTSRLVSAPYPYQLERAFPHLSFEGQRPLRLVFARDGTDRVFCVCQEGKIHVFPNRPDVNQTNVFLDLSKKISRQGNEEGLLGFALHPNYEQNGEFFVYYSAASRSVLSRMRVSPHDPNQADPDSEEVLLTIPQPYDNHNGGSIDFGPDGYLYIGLGDGGYANDPHGHAQNLQTLLGSILRIDVDHREAGKPYAIPHDNPFAGQGDKARGEIFAYGLRNVWQLAFDSKTGTLWAGDVGQHLFEEVNIITPGGNYGWNVREGLHPFDPASPWKVPASDPDRAAARARFIDPVVEYDHTEGRSVTGGCVYRGSRLPELDGAYLYADYVTGNVWAAYHDGQNLIRNVQLANPKRSIAGFGEAPDGEVYLCAFEGGIYRLRRSDQDGQSGGKNFPRRLSETGLFESVEELRPVPGMIPYSVNVPLWSDYAVKERYLALPNWGRVRYFEEESWKFPVGTVLVKTFLLDTTRGEPATRRRLETRLLVLSPSGWDGYVYVWNDEQTDALLIDTAQTKTFDVQTPEGLVQQAWYFPSRSDCHACHTRAAGIVLGTNTRQLNRTHSYADGADNQINHLAQQGVFRNPPYAEPAELEAFPDWDSQSAPAAELARAYLGVNCATCHRGRGSGTTRMDLRYHTPLDATQLLTPRPPKSKDSNRPAAALVVPGRPNDSELLFRMKLRSHGRMPPLGTSIPDREATQTMTRWIDELDETVAPASRQWNSSP